MYTDRIATAGSAPHPKLTQSRAEESPQIEEETFHSDWKMLSNHSAQTSDHKTKQSQF